MRSGSLHLAFRVGGFAALGHLLVTILHGRATDRIGLLISAAEVWAIVAVLWFALGAVSSGRR